MPAPPRPQRVRRVGAASSRGVTLELGEPVRGAQELDQLEIVTVAATCTAISAGRHPAQRRRRVGERHGQCAQAANLTVTPCADARARPIGCLSRSAVCDHTDCCSPTDVNHANLDMSDRVSRTRAAHLPNFLGRVPLRWGYGGDHQLGPAQADA